MRRTSRRIVLLVAVATAVLVIPAIAAGVSGFASGPVFGIDTAPNGDLLVADSGAGVHIFKGDTLDRTVPLPGATDVSHDGRRTMWVSTTGMDAEGDTGQGVWRVQGNRVRQVANLWTFEETENPDGQELDSNPFDIQRLTGRTALVADAGANALLKVNTRGRVDLVAAFGDKLVSTANIKALAGCPNPPVPDFAFACDLPEQMPAQAVPTSIAVGPDGDFYVGELVGFPAPTGESSVWRIHRRAHDAACPADCTEVLTGFTSIIDLAFGPDGRLYVAELDEASWAAVEFGVGSVGGTINACDLATSTCEVVASGIPMLTSIAFATAGNLHATRNGLIPPLAEVFSP